MKKLLSICFLSILLATMSLVAQAQSSTNCCFWLENLQPVTLHNIANIPGGGAAALPGTGGDVVLNNTMNRVDTGNYAQTDFYLIRFSNTCGLPATTKVSLEWKLYRDGQLVNDDLSNYADFRIYTRYNRLANATDPMNAGNSSCGIMRWMGGPVSGQGTCIEYQNYCVGGYPGAMQVEHEFPYATDSYTAAGYINLANGYALDYFNLPFFEATDHVIAISWKQVGNYSLVVGLRERTGGTAYPSLYWTNEEGMQNTALGAIGGHQSCCGDLLAQDSIHYLVETNSAKAVCDGETYDYGQPVATFSVEGRYLVIFGEETCEHFKVDHLDTLDFYTRINPDIKATDIELCHNVPFTSADLAALAPAVDTDAPGIVGYHVMWSTNGTTWSETVPTPSTAVPGTYTYYVQQTNDYDAVTDDEFSCTGKIDTLTMVVKPLLNPVVDPTTVDICNETIEDNTPYRLTSQFAADETCATEIRWYRGNQLVYTGFNYDVDLAALNPTNVDKQVVYTVVSASQYAESARATAPTVTINFWQTPIINQASTTTEYTVCPDFPVTLQSRCSVTSPAGTTLTYTWTHNGQPMNTNTADINIHAPLPCSQTDTYVVTVLATSPHGCTSTITRTFTVTSQDTRAITLTPKSSTRTTFQISGCDTNTVELPAPLTLAQLVSGPDALVTMRDNCSNVNRIVYTPEIVSSNSCTTVLRRTYHVEDSCGNISNDFVQTFTIVNDYKPVVTAGDLAIAPVPVMECKFDAPAYADLRAAFDANFRVKYVCDTFANHTVTFYFHGTNTVVDGNHDIFATTDTRLIDVVVTDPCGNVSVPSHVFTINRPAYMDITDGSISAIPDEICLHDTVFLNFDMTHIINATAPYTFEWKAEPNDGSIIHHTSPAAEGVPATANTDYIYRMVVTDRWGCMDSAYAEPVHVYGNPTAEIVPDIRNGAEFPLCPTYGVLTVEAIAEAGVPGEAVASYTWSGESVNVYSTNDTTGVYIIPDSCEHTYIVYLDVTNQHGCAVRAEYEFDVIDSVAPFFVTDGLITDSLVAVHENCVMYVPDFIPLFNNNNVKDNCYTLGQMTITQTPAAGTVIHADTPVSIVVTDGCGNQSVPYIITAKSASPIAVEISTSDDEFCQGPAIVLTANVTDAIMPVQFAWSNNTHNMTATVTPTEAAHVFAVTVTDAMGCQASDDIDITIYHVPTAHDATLTSTPNTYCDNADGIYDGTISVVSFNHPDVVAYKMSTDPIWHAADYVYTGLYQGSYYFDLKTIHDCEDYRLIKVVVEKDTNVVVPITTTTENAWCVAPFDGSITVTNPQVGYTYEIINLPNSEVLYTGGDLIYDNLEYGHYSIHVFTDKYCTYVKEDIIVDSARVYPSFHYTADPQTSCSTPNGAINVVNPVAGYHYIFNNIDLTGDPISFGGLNYGVYSVAVVTDKGCRKDFYGINVPSTTVNPTNPGPTVVNNSVCDPAITPNGSITIPATHTVEGFTYILNGEEVVATGVDPIVFANLGQVGSDVNYNLTVISDLGCTSTFTYAVNDVPFEVTFGNEITVVNQTNCDMIHPNGSITIAEQAGYSYEVYPAPVVRSSSRTLPTIDETSSLPAGSYIIVKIDDATGCMADTIVEIEFNKPAYTMNITVASDYDCSTAGNGSITVNNPAGFTFFLNGSDVPNTTGVFTGLNGPADYTILAINNATTCEYETTVTVDSVVITPIITTVSTAANYYCNDNKNGSVVLSSSVAGVTYYLNGTDYAQNNTTGIFENLNSGVYTYYAISENNCYSETDPVNVIDSAFIDDLRMHVVPNTMCVPTFEHPGNGQIIVDYPRGEQYDYKFYDAAGHEIEVGYLQPLSFVMYHLATGDYRVVVIDTVRGCSIEDNIYVPEGRDNVEISAEIVANVNCVYPYSGSITVSVTSDNIDGYYRYRIDPTQEFTDNNVFTLLNSGTYTVEVQDTTTGCIYAKENVIVPNESIYAPEITITEDSVFCLGSDASLFASATSALEGDVNFHYSWYSVCYGNVEGQTMPINTSHPGACDYTVTVVSDLTGCSSVKTKRVVVEDNPAINFLVDHVAYLGAEYAACANTFPHNIGVEPTGLVDFVWSNQATTDNFDVTLPAGNFCIFTVTVTDAYGCKNIDSLGVRALPLFDTIVEVNLCDADHTPFMGNIYTYDPVNPDNNRDTVTVVYTAVQNGCDSTVHYAVTLSAKPSITNNIDFDTYRCEGEALINSLQNSVTINWNGGVPNSFGWQRRLTSGGTATFDVTNPLTYALNGVQVRAFAINSCGESYTQWFTLRVDAAPIVGNLGGDHLFCVGDVVTAHLTAPSVECRNHNACTESWMISSDNAYYQDIISTLTADQNGYYVRYTVSNSCGTRSSSPVQIVVDDVPSATISGVTRCAGETITLADADLALTYNPALTTTAPLTSAVQHLGSTTYNGTALVEGSYNYYITLTNRCGSSRTNTVAVTVNDKPSILEVSVTNPCIAGYEITGPVIDWNGNVGTVVMEYSVADNDEWTVINSINDITLDLNGVDLRFTATNSCGSDARVIKTLPVYDAPVVELADYNDVVCENSSLTIPTDSLTINWNNNVGTNGYQIRYAADADFVDWTNGSVLTSHEFVEIRAYATNDCGTVYDTISIIVEDLPVLSHTGDLTQTLCKGSDIAPVTFASNKELTLTPVSAGAPALTLVDGVLSGVANASVSSANYPTVYTYTIETVEGHCGTESETFTLNLIDKPVITSFIINNNGMCPGTNVSLSSSTKFYGDYDNRTMEVAILRANSTEWQVLSTGFPISVSYPVTNADTNAIIRYIANNNCGSDTAFVTLHVAADPVIPAITAVDTCAGEAISTFVPAPEFVVNEYSTVQEFGWYYGTNKVTNPSFVVNADADVYYYVQTQCGTFTSNTVHITVHDAPEITIAVTNEFEICSGGQFTEPTYTVDNHGATQLSANWTITKAGATEAEALDFTATYDDSYNNATIALTVVNTCGQDVENFTATVHSLPVPEILHDTIICHDGTTELSVVNPKTTSTYEWYQTGTAASIASTPTTTIDATLLDPADATYTYYVVETDEFGCVSETNVNAGYQPIASDVVTIKVTDKPRFIFKDENGVVTHFIDGVETNGTDTHYSWQVFNPCYNEDTLVYVTFDIYHDGQLIPDDQIGQYITNYVVNSHQYWNTCDSINWLYYTGTPMHYVTYYATAQSGISSTYANHYPNSNLNMSSGIYDDFYLHFLADREVFKTIRPFRQPGTYTIVYRLWETSNVDRYASYYQNDAHENRYVGGYNAMISSAIRDVLVIDSITITVTGDALVPSTDVAPALAPQSTTNASEPVVKLYPNPAVNEVNAEIKGIAGNTTIQVVNLAGKVVAEEVVNIPATGSYKYTRTVNEFTPGVYFIYIKNESATLSKKLVITK